MNRHCNHRIWTAKRVLQPALMIFLALRYMFAKKKQTCFILLGIFLGTCGFVTLSGFLLGWQEYFIQEMVHNDAHLFIRAKKQPVQEHDLDRFFYSKNIILSWFTPPAKTNSSESIENPKKWTQILGTDPRVCAYSPRFNTMALFSGKTTEAILTSLIGCHPEQEIAIKNLKQYVTQGKFDDIAIGSNRLAIGEGLRKFLNVKLHQTIMVSVAQNPPIPFKVVAVFHTKNFITDLQAYGLVQHVQEVAKKPNQINEIAIKLYDHTLASRIASSWMFLGVEKIESWDQLYANIFQMCLINNAIRFATTGIIMLVAGFGIYNVLNMSVLQKRKDIVILQSIGYSSRHIMMLFFSQGIMLGILGSALGVTFGYLICLLIQNALSSEFFPISFSLSIYIEAVLLGIGFAGVSSLFPARFAKKMTPIEIIRSGAD